MVSRSSLAKLRIWALAKSMWRLSSGSNCSVARSISSRVTRKEGGSHLSNFAE